MFDLAVQTAAQAHALAEYPKEAVGLVAGGSYRAFANAASDPHEAFALPAEGYALIAAGGVEAVIHSHCAPRHLPWPTAADMRCQQQHGIPFGIVWTEGESTSPILWWGDHTLDDSLIGRRFIPGIFDCYALARGYFWQQRKVKLPEVPRDHEWWERGGDLFTDGFAAAGFRKIDAGEAMPGDCVLMRIGKALVPHHCGMLLARDLILHHLAGRFSRREPFGPWEKFVTHWLRYGPHPSPPPQAGEG